MKIYIYFFFVCLTFAWPQIANQPFTAENIGLSMPDLGVGYNRYGWFTITGEIATKYNWTANKIQICAKVGNYYDTSKYFTTEMSLSAPSRKRFFLHVIPKTYQDIELEFRVQDQVYPGPKITIDYDSSEDFLNVGYLPAKPEHHISSLQNIKDFPGWNIPPQTRSYRSVLSRIYVSKIETNKLPNQWFAYTATDILILGTDQNLSTEQQQAIGQWVYAGGIVMFMPSDTTWLLNSDWAKQLLSVDINNKNHRKQNIAVLGTQIQSCITCPAPKQATSLTGHPANLFWQFPVGAGSIMYCGVPLGDSQAISSEDTTLMKENIWTELVIPMFQEAMQKRNSYLGYDISANSDNSYRSSEEQLHYALDVGRKTAPGLHIILLLLMLYIVLIGPINFTYLRRKNRTIYLIWTIPLCALSFIFVILIYGYCIKGNDTRGQRVQIVHPIPQTQFSNSQEYCGILAGSQGLYNFEMKNNGYIRQLMRYNRTPIRYDETSNLKIVNHPFNLWSMDYFVTNSLIPYLDITAQMEKNHQRYYPTNIQINNNTSLTLQHPVLFYKERYYNFSDKKISAGKNTYEIRNDYSESDGIQDVIRENWANYLDEDTLEMIQNIYVKRSGTFVLAWIIEPSQNNILEPSITSSEKIGWNSLTLVCIDVTN